MQRWLSQRAKGVYSDEADETEVSGSELKPEQVGETEPPLSPMAQAGWVKQDTIDVRENAPTTCNIAWATNGKFAVAYAACGWVHCGRIPSRRTTDGERWLHRPFCTTRPREMAIP